MNSIHEGLPTALNRLYPRDSLDWFQNRGKMALWSSSTPPRHPLLRGLSRSTRRPVLPLSSQRRLLHLKMRSTNFALRLMMGPLCTLTAMRCVTVNEGPRRREEPSSAFFANRASSDALSALLGIFFFDDVPDMSGYPRICKKNCCTAWKERNFALLPPLPALSLFRCNASCDDVNGISPQPQ